MRIVHNGRTLQYKKIVQRNPVVANKDLTKKRNKIAYKPAKNYSWNRPETYKRLMAMKSVLEGQKAGASEKELITT
ncbi:MAG: hypothetical protein KAS05_00105 [Candidatus Omnitrophica bacterium]|nr:hypothetical protein [Candidatus Omnitrophota bacterium]